jgi:SAM-dependent methyltransferase
MAVGIDRARRPLLRATARAAPARAVQGDAVCLPFRDGAFGLVVVAHVLEHVARWREMIHDCQRVLGADGTLALVSSPGFQRNAPRSALRRALAARGWVNQRPGPSGRTEIEASLDKLGIEYELLEETAWRWTRRQRIGTSLEFILRDEYSAFWSAPPDLLADAKREVIAEFAGSADEIETVAASVTCLVVDSSAAS